jgi:hypothetical protein
MDANERECSFMVRREHGCLKKWRLTSSDATTLGALLLCVKFLHGLRDTLYEAIHELSKFAGYYDDPQNTGRDRIYA